MLAAIPDNPRPLEVVKLVLSMIASDDENIPPALKDFLINVINEAKIVAADPQKVSNIQYFEAIQLAFEMKMEVSLAQTLSHVTNFESIRPDLANSVLTTMDLYPA